MYSQLHVEPPDCYGNASDALVGRIVFNEDIAWQ